MRNYLPSLTIFFPAYNDEKTIGQLVKDAYETGKKVTKDLEIIVINDGSFDHTWEVLTKLKKAIPVHSPVRHEKNQGYGAALRSGFSHATKEFIFYTDGDAQYDPKELVRLVQKMKDGIDVVNGYKMKRADPQYRIIVGKLYNWLCHVEYKLPIRDVQCDFRLIRKSALKPFRLRYSSGAFCLELVLKLKLFGARFAEAPVHHYPRRYGKSQFFQPYKVVRALYHHLAIYLYHRSFMFRQLPASTDML